MNFYVFGFLDAWIFVVLNLLSFELFYLDFLFWIFKFSNVLSANFQFFEYSNCRIFVFSEFRIFIFRFLYSRIDEILNFWIFECLNFCIFEVINFWIILLRFFISVSWISELSNFQYSDSTSVKLLNVLIVKFSNFPFLYSRTYIKKRWKNFQVFESLNLRIF